LTPYCEFPGTPWPRDGPAGRIAELVTMPLLAVMRVARLRNDRLPSVAIALPPRRRISCGENSDARGLRHGHQHATLSSSVIKLTENAYHAEGVAAPTYSDHPRPQLSWLPTARRGKWRSALPPTEPIVVGAALEPALRRARRLVIGTKRKRRGALGISGAGGRPAAPSTCG